MIREVAGAPAGAVRLRPVLASAALVVAVLVLPAGAHAYVRTTTCAAVCNDVCANRSNGVCEDGAAGSSSDVCRFGQDCSDCGYRAAPSTSGFRCRDNEVPIPIRWPVRCVGYHVNERGSLDEPDFQRLVATIRRSFDTWNAVECSYFQAVYAGETDEDRPGYSTCAANTNFVGFVEQSWNSRGYPSHALALTSVTFDVRDGVIVDADIEMNSANFTFASGDDPSPGALQDLENTLTHEVGHFLGLDHARPETHVGEGQYVDATMADSSGPGETMKRDLLEDDIAGVCAIYPADAPDAPSSCDVGGVGFFSRPGPGPGEECPDTTEAKESGCCTTARGPRASAFAILAVLLGLRRRR